MLTFATGLEPSTYAPFAVVLDADGPWQALVPDSLRVLSLGRPRLRSALVDLVRVLRGERPAIVVSSMVYMNMGLLLVKPFLSGRPRVIVREANSPGRQAATALGRFACRLGYRWLYRAADKVLCPAAYIRDVLVTEYGVDPARAVVLPNPLDEDLIRAGAVPGQRIPGQGLRFVCVGRLTAQKGYDRLLDDFARMPADARLTIFGEGELREALQCQIERLGLSQRVTLAGFDPNPAPWLAGADALLLPSRWEGMPNVALEALACGAPVIATPEAGGIVEIAAQAVHGAVTLVSSGSEFSAAMQRVTPRAEASLRASLLPLSYKIDRVTKEFAAILAA